MSTWSDAVDVAHAKYQKILAQAEAIYRERMADPTQDEAAINAEYATVTLAAHAEYDAAVQAAYAAEHDGTAE